MSFLKPDTPDYAAAAREQGAANVETAKVEGALNRPDVYDWRGSQTWNTVPDPSSPTGFRYVVNNQLQPAEQQKYDIGNQIALNGLYSLWNYGSPAIDKALQGSYSLAGNPLMGYDPQYGPTTNFQENSGAEYAPGLKDRLDYSGVTGIPEANAGVRDQVAQSVYGQGARFLDPRFKREEDALSSQLSNQGIFVGSDAYKDAQNQLGEEKNQAYGDLQDRAVQMGGSEMERLFGMQGQQHQMGTQDVGTQANFANSARGQFINELLADQQARNAAIGNEFGASATGSSLYNTGRAQSLQEMAQSKTMPINIMSALLSGSQVNAPQFQPFNNQIGVQAPPVYQAAVNQGQAGQAQAQNWMNLAGGLGGAGIYKWSDRRLKSNIERKGTRYGLPWYEYDIGGRREEGVMADEVQRLYPEAVAERGGFLMVNYGVLERLHGGR